MKISVITPNYNGARFLEQCLQSIEAQRSADLDIEHIVIDGGSSDESHTIVEQHRDQISEFVSEPDSGPANAINKGLSRASGDILCWLNADDLLAPGALARVARTMQSHPDRALCFGHCPIIDEQGREIRRGITRFKECCFPISGRFTIQCINYISQPATFFRKAAYDVAGPLREDLTAAWDYDLWLRLWRCGGAVRIEAPALASFRWHKQSISGQQFRTQFREEWDVARADSGAFSPQAFLHTGVWWGIVGSYSAMQWLRRHEK